MTCRTSFNQSRVTKNLNMSILNLQIFPEFGLGVIVMFDFKKVPLPDYTRLEDTINSATHALGVPLSILAIVLSALKIKNGATSAEIAGIVIYGICMALLYFGSAFYHGLKPGFLKQVARVIDHSNVFLMIAGSLSAYFLLGVFSFNKVLSIVLLVLSWVGALSGIFLTLMDQERFKKIQMVMYIFLGWLALFSMKTIYDNYEAGKLIIILLIVGGVVYMLGAAVYGIGKKKRYFHAIFHFFVLAGTAIQFVGIYNYLL